MDRWTVAQVKGLGPIIRGPQGEHVATVYKATAAPLLAASPLLFEALFELCETLDQGGFAYLTAAGHDALEKALDK